MADRSYLSIGEVLSLLQPEFTDLTISKIRFLESQGLLEPERTPSGYRKFYANDIERLRWILRQQREQYLPLKVIRGRLDSDPDDETDGDDANEPGAADGAMSGASREAESDGQVSIGAAADQAVAEGADTPEPAAAPPPMRAPDTSLLAPTRSGVSLTAEELSTATGLDATALKDLERYGLVNAKVSGATAYYDEEALAVARLAAGFMRHGVEARHLRMYKTAAEREAGLFEQLVMPLLKQRNPRARREAMERLTELATLGEDLRAAMLRLVLRDELG
ncbi:MAG: MerR family transcriptional regulator [Acidimicrobiales bacterium]